MGVCHACQGFQWVFGWVSGGLWWVVVGLGEFGVGLLWVWVVFEWFGFSTGIRLMGSKICFSVPPNTPHLSCRPFSNPFLFSTQ